MNLHEIMTLLDAGYTKDEIQNLEIEEANTKIINDLKSAPEAKPEAEPEAEPEAAPAPALEAKPDAEPTLADVLKQMEKLTATIQANALAQTQINGQPKQPTAEDMIAQIIRPTRKERDA